MKTNLKKIATILAIIMVVAFVVVLRIHGVSYPVIIMNLILAPVVLYMLLLVIANTVVFFHPKIKKDDEED